VGSFESAPAELTLDLDCTDDRVHGLQEGRHFHGYYYDFCFLPHLGGYWREPGIQFVSGFAEVSGHARDSVRFAGGG
jgi:hypothetical protein